MSDDILPVSVEIADSTLSSLIVALHVLEQDEERVSSRSLPGTRTSASAHAQLVASLLAVTLRFGFVIGEARARGDTHTERAANRLYERVRMIERRTLLR